MSPEHFLVAMAALATVTIGGYIAGCLIAVWRNRRQHPLEFS